MAEKTGKHENWGGPRIRAGRPSMGLDQRIAVAVSDDAVAYLDQVREDQGLKTRSAALRYLIRRCERIGMGLRR